MTAYIGCNVELVIEFSSNAATEEFAIDDVSFSTGMTLSTEQFNLDHELSLYPNPSKGVINIKNNRIALESVSITDINGRTIETINLNGTTSNTTLDMSSELSSGLYFVSIISDKGSVTKKLIIE